MNIKQRPKTTTTTTTTTVQTSTSLPSSPLKLSFRTNQLNYSHSPPTLSSPTTPTTASTSTSTMSTSSYCMTPLSKLITSSQKSTRCQASPTSLKSSHSSSPLSRQVLHFHKCIKSDCIDPTMGSVRAISRRFANEDGSGSIECTSVKHQLIPDEPVLPYSPVRSSNRDQFRAKNSSSPFTYIETMSTIRKKQPNTATSRRNVNLDKESPCQSTRSTPGRSVSFKLEKVSPQTHTTHLPPSLP